jgi:hypothetical protein
VSKGDELFGGVGDDAARCVVGVRVLDLLMVAEALFTPIKPAGSGGLSSLSTETTGALEDPRY